MSGDMIKKPSAPTPVAGGSSRAEIDTFIASANALGPVQRFGKGRLLFALDATMSRQPTWDAAIQLQGEMLKAAGGDKLEMAIGYFRGFNECRISKYSSDVSHLVKLMSGVRCLGGNTQIDRLLKGGVLKDVSKPDGARVVVFVGDAFEESDNIDAILHTAGEIKRTGARLFMFQEGSNPHVEDIFRRIAQSGGGLYARFDKDAPDQLSDLMKTVAAYAAAADRPRLSGHHANSLAFQNALAALPPPQQG